MTVRVAGTRPARRHVLPRPWGTCGRAGSRRPTRSRYQIGSRQHTKRARWWRTSPLSCSIGKVRSLPVKSCPSGMSRWKPSQSSVRKMLPSIPTLSSSRRQVASSRPPSSQAKVRRATGSKARQSQTSFFLGRQSWLEQVLLEPGEIGVRVAPEPAAHDPRPARRSRPARSSDHRRRSAAASSRAETGRARVTTPATSRTAPRSTSAGEAALRPVARRSWWRCAPNSCSSPLLVRGRPSTR